MLLSHKREPNLMKLTCNKMFVTWYASAREYPQNPQNVDYIYTEKIAYGVTEAALDEMRQR